MERNGVEVCKHEPDRDKTGKSHWYNRFYDDEKRERLFLFLFQLIFDVYLEALVFQQIICFVLTFFGLCEVWLLGLVTEFFKYLSCWLLAKINLEMFPGVEIVLF